MKNSVFFLAGTVVENNYDVDSRSLFAGDAGELKHEK